MESSLPKTDLWPIYSQAGKQEADCLKKQKRPLLLRKTAFIISGSPCATLFITVLFLPQLTKNLQYQRVIKDQAVPARRKRR
jgi:hypothetical protein